MASPAIQLRLPPLSLFHFPPDPLPTAIPPPIKARTFASPFPIDAGIYNAALDWKVPITIGTIYATTVILINQYNRRNGYKPWAISKTRAFFYFVVLHNVFLAVFSALTFVGMIRALAHTWPGRRDLPFLGKLWPGLRTQNGLAGAADALCKIHGPRDLGDAVFYSPEAHAWMVTNRMIKLSPEHAPDASDVGRLWNEGLAFWGWWFYLSKFYEVLDTLIILVKGKRSSTLQTYHHFGAMLSMWAGMRYMSPPIWMFCFLNSFIHALMYTYYTLSVLSIRVPQGVKRTLTTMQISQFLIGITFATLHLFVHYTVPVSTPYTWTKTVSSAISVASAAVSAAPSAAAGKATELMEAPGLALFLRKMFYRIMGEEGLAQQWGPKAKPPIGSPPVNFTEYVHRETKWRTQYEFVSCIDTEGQAFAVWVNVVYLIPLTGLFVRFFIRAYSGRSSFSGSGKKPGKVISKALEDAAHGAARELDNVGKSMENSVGDPAVNLNGSNKPKTSGNSKQRVAENASQFELRDESDGSPKPVDRKTSSEPLKVGSIRKRASEEQNKLRKMFEEGQEFGRSVSPSSSILESSNVDFANASDISETKGSQHAESEEQHQSQSQLIEDKAVDEVEKSAGESVGGQRAKSPESESVQESITNGNTKESNGIVSRSSSLRRMKRSLIPKLSWRGNSPSNKKPSLSPSSTILSPAVTTTSASQTVAGANASSEGADKRGAVPNRVLGLTAEQWAIKFHEARERLV